MTPEEALQPLIAKWEIVREWVPLLAGINPRAIADVAESVSRDVLECPTIDELRKAMHAQALYYATETGETWRRVIGRKVLTRHLQERAPRAWNAAGVLLDPGSASMEPIVQAWWFAVGVADLPSVPVLPDELKPVVSHMSNAGAPQHRSEWWARETSSGALRIGGLSRETLNWWLCECFASTVLESTYPEFPRNEVMPREPALSILYALLARHESGVKLPGWMRRINDGLPGPVDSEQKVRDPEYQRAAVAAHVAAVKDAPGKVPSAEDIHAVLNSVITRMATEKIGRMERPPADH